MLLLCHKFCGGKIELAHIEQEAHGGLPTLDNCIPLCFDCHADTGHYNVEHPKGKKYTPSELRAHRDKWYAKVGQSGGLEVTAAHRQIDSALFSKIAGVLPVDGSMAFIEQFDFEVPFDFARLKDLNGFEELCRRPDVEFLDAALESLRESLSEAVSHFWHLLANNMFSSPQ